MVHVRFYARLADQAGCTEAEVEGAPFTMEELLQKLSGQYPGVQFGGILCAVNGVSCRMDRVIESGSVVSLLPPLAGG